MEAYTEDASTLYSAVIEKTMARLSPVFRQTGHFESERKALENLWKAKLVKGGTLRSPDTAAPRRLPTLLASPFALTNPFETAPAAAAEIKAEPSPSLKRPREEDALAEEEEGSEQDDDDEEGDELAALMPAELRGNRSALAMLKKHTTVQAFGDDTDAGATASPATVAAPSSSSSSTLPLSRPSSSPTPVHPAHHPHSQPLPPVPAPAPVAFHTPAKKAPVPVPVSVDRKLKSALSWKQRLNLKKKTPAPAPAAPPTPTAAPAPPAPAGPPSAPPPSSSTTSVSSSSGAPTSASTLDFTFTKEPAADSLDNSSLESLSDNSDIETDNVLICTFEVVKKKKSKWSWELSNGLMLADGRDYFVKSAKGGGFWM